MSFIMSSKMRNVALSMMLPLIVQLQTARPILKESRHNNYFRRNDFHDCLREGKYRQDKVVLAWNLEISASRRVRGSRFLQFLFSMKRLSVRPSVCLSVRPPVRPSDRSSIRPSVRPSVPPKSLPDGCVIGKF